MSMNMIEFGNDFIGVMPFDYADEEYAQQLSSKIFRTFGFENPSEYIDSMPDSWLHSKTPYIKVVNPGTGSRSIFTTVAYSEPDTIPYDNHPVLFTYRVLYRSATIDPGAISGIDFINGAIRDGFDSGGMLLIRPKKSSMKDYLWGFASWVDLYYWYCSDYRD